MSGVKIGTVPAIALNPESLRADATVTIRQDVEIPDDLIAAISSEGLLGGNFVEVLPGGSPFVLENDMAFPETQGALDLLNLLSRFVGGRNGPRGSVNRSADCGVLCQYGIRADH